MTTPAKAAIDDATTGALANLALGAPELLGEGLQLRQEMQERSGGPRADGGPRPGPALRAL